MISLKQTLSAITSKFTALNTLLNDVPHYTLLWTNPNPTSAFAAQTISLDLSKYDAVAIDLTMYTAGSNVHNQTFLGSVGSSMILSGILYSTAPTDLMRIGDVTASGVIFNNGRAYGAVNNGAVIPYKIYGIKFGGGV